MELLLKSSQEMIRIIEKLVNTEHIPLAKYPVVNPSSDKSLVLSIWRPINYILKQILHALIAVSKTQKKYPFRKFRYSFFRLKTTINPVLNKIFLNTKSIDIENFEGYQKLIDRYQEVNNRLESILDIDLKRFGYRVK